MTSMRILRGRSGRGRLGRLWRRDDGTATIEFVLALPVAMAIFMASFESGLYMLREVMLDRGLDLVMRDYRLGRLPKVTHDQLRDLVCAATPVISDCRGQLKVWVSPINTASWAVPVSDTYCGDGNGTLTAQTSGTVKNGRPNEMMFVRVCTIEKPIFPTTGIGLQLRADSLTGGYQIAAQTVVVNEPE